MTPGSTPDFVPALILWVIWMTATGVFASLMLRQEFRR